ncbi:MAG: ABC transporter substrate-binding protein, partial [Campylobacteraceae bacterium]|nr:ABC transporter substrate-binding protein [Campylobacteraceae bacterium]
MNHNIVLSKPDKFLFVFSLFFILSQSLLLAENKKVTLQLTWLHQFQFAGYYMAKEMGYYDDVGIDLEIKEYTYETKIIDEVQNKKVDFAVGRSSIIIDKINGKDIVALGAIFQSNPLMLLVREDSGISSIEDLRYKKIMIANISKSRASIIAMLNAHGLKPRDVEIIPHSFDLNDLISNKVDAMASYLSNEPLRLEDKNIAYKVFHPKDYGFDFYGDILFTTSAFIKDNPKLTRDFYEASIKGWKYAFSNIVKTSELIHKKYNTQNKTFINYVKEGEVLKKLTYIAVENGKHNLITHPTLGLLEENKLKEIVGVYKVMGLVNKDLNMKEFIYEFNHPKMLDVHFSHQELYFGSLFTLFIIFALFYSNKKKKWLLTKNELEEEVEMQRRALNKNNRVLMVQSKLAALGEMLGNIAH